MYEQPRPMCQCHDCTQARVNPMERVQWIKPTAYNGVVISKKDIFKAYDELHRDKNEFFVFASFELRQV